MQIYPEVHSTAIRCTLKIQCIVTSEKRSRDDIGNLFTSARTVVSNKFVSFFMCNLNYHLEHHLFPGVPCYNLPKVHALLSNTYRQTGSSVYHGYTDFLADFFRVTLHGIIPNIRLIPDHVREEICA